MGTVRIIARLDIKGQNLIKGIHFEGLRVVGDPNERAFGYYQQGIDELFYQDLVASLYRRNNLAEIVRRTSENIFIPLTVAGGIRSVDDARELLRAGADKVAINTAAIQRPELIREVAEEFGSQCMVLSVEAKKVSENNWEPYTDMGREPSGKDLVEWVLEAQELGVGEILLTSIDRDGTRKGFDLELVSAVSEIAKVPLIASGGLGSPEDFSKAVSEAGADAIAVGEVLHFDRYTVADLRAHAEQCAINVRRI